MAVSLVWSVGRRGGGEGLIKDLSFFFISVKDRGGNLSQAWSVVVGIVSLTRPYVWVAGDPGSAHGAMAGANETSSPGALAPPYRLESSDGSHGGDGGGKGRQTWDACLEKAVTTVADESALLESQ